VKKSTLNKRANTAASAKQAGALSLFHRAADDLEAAAAEHRSVRDEALAIADQHHAVAQDASVAAEQSLVAAAKIRELAG
jgi:hypothetical protein